MPNIITEITFPGVSEDKVMVSVRRVPGFDKPKQKRMMVPANIVVRLADSDGQLLAPVCSMISEQKMAETREQITRPTLVYGKPGERPTWKFPPYEHSSSPIPDEDIYG
jgi:hypothetical protein